MIWGNMGRFSKRLKKIFPSSCFSGRIESFDEKKRPREITGVLFIYTVPPRRIELRTHGFSVHLLLPTELKRQLFFKDEIIYMFKLKSSSTFYAFYIVFIDFVILFFFKKFGYISYIKEIFNSVFWLFAH